jgi:hypothetical protein
MVRSGHHHAASDYAVILFRRGNIPSIRVGCAPSHKAGRCWRASMGRKPLTDWFRLMGNYGFSQLKREALDETDLIG